jgi:ribonuclease D
LDNLIDKSNQKSFSEAEHLTCEQYAYAVGDCLYLVATAAQGKITIILSQILKI